MSTLSIQTPRAFLPLLRPARYKGAHGGRGSGKSHFFAERVIVACITDHTTRVVCVREIQKSLDQSVKQLIADKIEALGVQGYFEVLDTEIHVLDDAGKRSGLIIFQGMQNHTADSIKSLEGYSIAWVEEAQSLSKRSLELLTPTLRKAGAEIWFSWNPRKDTDPVDVFMRGEGSEDDPDIVCIEVNYTDNPWFGETALYGDMQRDKRRDPDKYAHVWGGGYEGRGEATVFRNWREERFETPEGAVFRFGADWGFAQDPTVLIRCYIDGETLYVDQEAYEVGCEIDDTPALFAGTDTNKPPRWKNDKPRAGIPGALKWTITADSARPETVSYMRRHGFKMLPAIKGPGSIEDGVSFLKSFDIVVHPRCVGTIKELKAYSYKVDQHTKEVLPILEDKDNNVIDSLRYALEALRRAGKRPVETQAKPIDRYNKPKTREASWMGM